MVSPFSQRSHDHFVGGASSHLSVLHGAWMAFTYTAGSAHAPPCQADQQCLASCRASVPPASPARCAPCAELPGLRGAGWVGLAAASPA